MADTLRSIADRIPCECHHCCQALESNLTAPCDCSCPKHRLLALLDAAEKTDLVQLVALHEKSAVLAGEGEVTVWCNCERTFISRFTEEPDAHEKWAAHRADELRDWLVARDKETGGK